ncbi:MAG: hypothetical protein ABSA84_08255 [Gammaproteobacteria bacterium]
MPLPHLNDILLTILTTEYEHLDYGCLSLTDLDLEKICTKLIENPNVKKIGLWMNNINDEGAEHIVNLLSDPRCVLRDINLSGNNIGYYGVKKICDKLDELEKTSGVKIKVNLRDNPGFHQTNEPSVPRKIGYRYS